MMNKMTSAVSNPKLSLLLAIALPNTDPGIQFI